MAIIKRGILGGFSNKIGNVVGTSWKGISVMRSLPQSVHNPKTEAQEEQRTNFAVASKLGSQLLDSVIKPFWDKKAIRMSGYNLWVQKNLDRWRSLGTSYNDYILITEGAPVEIPNFEPVAYEGVLGVYGDFAFECSKLDKETAKSIGIVINSSGTEVLGIAEGEGIPHGFLFPCISTEDGLKAQFYGFAYDPQTMATTGSVHYSIRLD